MSGVRTLVRALLDTPIYRGPRYELSRHRDMFAMYLRVRAFQIFGPYLCLHNHMPIVLVNQQFHLTIRRSSLPKFNKFYLTSLIGAAVDFQKLAGTRTVLKYWGLTSVAFAGFGSKLCKVVFW